MRRFPHIAQLDGIRAIAVALVFVAHAGFERLVPGGFGVTIFFFLSGYLITSLLVHEQRETGRVSLPAFYVRRTLRIGPPLWITLALCAMTLRLGWMTFDVDPWGVVAQLTFLINYSSLWGHPEGLPYLPLWSLAVEEHFYLLFPFAFAIYLARKKPVQAAAACACACILVLALRIATVIALPDYGNVYFWSHTRIDSILFGCCLALWRNPVLDGDYWRPKLWHASAALAVLLACFLVRSEPFRQTIRYSLQGAALYVVFTYVLVDRGFVYRALTIRPMRLLGLYSYTFYLVHYIWIGIVYTRFPTLPFAVRMTLAFALSVAYAAAMYRSVESRLARLRKRLHTDHVSPTTGTVAEDGEFVHAPARD